MCHDCFFSRLTIPAIPKVTIGNSGVTSHFHPHRDHDTLLGLSKPKASLESQAAKIVQKVRACAKERRGYKGNIKKEKGKNKCIKCIYSSEPVIFDRVSHCELSTVQYGGFSFIYPA